MSASRIPMPPRADRGPAAPARPWYREPMLWLVIALPALAVAGAIASVVTAFATRDSVVADEFRKEGLAINRDPARDLAARRLGVSATLTAGDGLWSVRLAPGAAAPPAQLVVVLSHATRAELDRLVTLRAGADGSYQAPLEALAPGHWYLELSPADRSWRLTGEFVDRVGTLTLRPGTVP